MDAIFHVTPAADWGAAQAAGEYRMSTRGRSLEDEGFIHASRWDQVERVANVLYRGQQGLVLLVIDCGRLAAPLREETPDGALEGEGERFPHIYGPLNLDAVVEVVPFEPQADGTFSLPPRPRA